MFSRALQLKEGCWIDQWLGERAFRQGFVPCSAKATLQGSPANPRPVAMVT